MDPLGEGASATNQWGGSSRRLSAEDEQRQAGSISPLGPRPPLLPGETGGHYRPPSHQQQPRMQPRDAQTGPDEAEIERRSRSSGVTDSGNSSSANAQRPAAGPPFLRVKVIGLDKNKRECYIKFNAETNMPAYKHSLYRNVSRSFGEFHRYAEAVAANNPQSIVPALPLTQTSAARDEDDDRLVKLAFAKWLTRMFDEPSIRRDDETLAFVTSEFGYTPHTKSTRKIPSAASMMSASTSASALSSIPGFRSVVNAVASTSGSTSSTGYVDPDDELSVTKAAMSKLEHSFLQMHKAIEKTAKARRNMATSLLELGEAYNNLAAVEDDVPLGTGLKKMSIASKRQADVAASHASGEQVSLGDVMLYQSANARSARETLACRDGVVDEHRAAVKATLSCKRAIEKLKNSSNIKADRVDEALEELEDARRHEQTLAQRLAAISTHLSPSVRMHSKHTHEDILQALANYAQVNLSHEKQILKDLELLKPEIEAIGTASASASTTTAGRDAGVYVHPPSLGTTGNGADGVASIISSPSAHPQQSPTQVKSAKAGLAQQQQGQPTKAGTGTGQQKWKRVDARMAASLLSNGF